MSLFNRKKKEEPAAAQMQGISPEQITSLRQKGYPDDQIIQYLQNQGFAPAQISDAMSQADMAAGGVGIIPPPEIPIAQPSPIPPVNVHAFSCSFIPAHAAYFLIAVFYKGLL